MKKYAYWNISIYVSNMIYMSIYIEKGNKVLFYNSFTTNFLSLATPEAEATLNGLNHINSQHTYVLIFRSTASIA